MEFSFNPAPKKPEEDPTLDAPIKGFKGNGSFNSEKKKVEHKDMVNASIKRQEAAYKERLAEETSRLFRENPGIYEYDAIYDQIKPSVGAKNTSKRESQYMQSIFREHSRRGREQQIALEKIEEKDRDRERRINGDLPEQRFVTAGFKKFQEMRQKQEKIEMAEQVYNKKHSVQHSEEGMMGFYSRFLNQNADREKKAEDKLRENTIDKAEKEINRVEMVKQEAIKKKVAEMHGQSKTSKETVRERSRSKERTKRDVESDERKEPEVSREEKIKAALERRKARANNPNA
eukprot:TRINITY_DN3088_c0_g1_i8.p1 TRINITY_DN3088_c0_g1~~TRINITY_DN3088_c0_g1_i8.p1  ORF type:complete len:289 (+),score=104.22 TRINITY_DN3088_c0_g1_i8:81-947(+)